MMECAASRVGVAVESVDQYTGPRLFQKKSGKTFDRRERLVINTCPLNSNLDDPLLFFHRHRALHFASFGGSSVPVEFGVRLRPAQIRERSRPSQRSRAASTGSFGSNESAGGRRKGLFFATGRPEKPRHAAQTALGWWFILVLDPEI